MAALRLAVVWVVVLQPAVLPLEADGPRVVFLRVAADSGPRLDGHC